MTVPWVVTYRMEFDGGVVTFEGYRGDESECDRIADQSVCPPTYKGHKVTSFDIIVGPAKDWEDFLKEQNSGRAQSY